MRKFLNKVFLGGTCATSTWRDQLIKVIQVPYFNPVVKDWTPECQQIEIDEKQNECNIHLYVITADSTNTFSIAEIIDSAHTKGKITILHVIPVGIEGHQLKAFKVIVGMVVGLGGIAYIEDDLNRTARVINNCFKIDTNDTF